MTILRKFARGFLALFQKKQFDNELEEELRGFIEAAAEQKMRAGMSREEAFRAAHTEMGSTAAVRDQVNESGWESVIESIWQDLRYCFRILRSNPGFTALAVLTLAVGMGASTTVFTWIDTVLLNPLPGVPTSGEVVAFENITPNGQFVTVSYPDYRDYRDHLKLLEGITATRPSALALGEEDHSQTIWGQFVTGNYFAVLQVQPEMGRVFLPAEYADTPNAFPVAVISHRLWQSRFNSAPEIIGKTIHVNRHELTVVGVTRRDFNGSMVGLQFDIWIPYMMRAELQSLNSDWLLGDRNNRDVLAMARLQPGVSVEQAQSEIAEFARQLAKLYPEYDQGMSATVLPLKKGHFGPQGLLLGPLQILMAAACVLLLIVCSNVANLLLAKSTVRRREFSLRLALGAKRTRLARQLLTEGLLLAAAASILGTCIAIWLGHSLPYLLPPRDVPLTLDVHVNVHLLVFAGLTCVITALLSSLIPALQSVRANLNDTLKESGRTGTSGPRSHRTRAALVIAEVSLALVTLISAGVFVRSFQASEKIDVGFDPRSVLLSRFFPSTTGYNLEQRKQFCIRLREKLEEQPGVTAVAYSDGVPLGYEPSWWENLKIKGYVPATGENMKIYRNVVSPGYFSLMHIPLKEGRDFTEHDDEKSAPVVIVSQAFAKHFLGKGMALGRQVYGWGRWFTVVGIAQDSKYHYPTEATIPYFYVPFRQVFRADMALTFYIKTSGDPVTAISTMREAVYQIDPNVTIFNSVPMTQFIGASLFPQKIAAALLGALGFLSLLLAAIGLYSVMAYSVAQRTHEIGIRMALGAKSTSVLKLVIHQGMRLTLAGLLLGGVAALLVSRNMAAISLSGPTMAGAGNLLGGSAIDPVIYIGAAAFLAAVALLASYIPARRATKVDPLVALRYE